VLNENEWNVKQWAADHDAKDNFRFAIVWRVFAVGGAAVLAVLGWSLKSQYDTAYATQQSVQQMGSAIVQELHRQTEHFDTENQPNG